MEPPKGTSSGKSLRKSSRKILKEYPKGKSLRKILKKYPKGKLLRIISKENPKGTSSRKSLSIKGMSQEKPSSKILRGNPQGKSKWKRRRCLKDFHLFLFVCSRMWALGDSFSYCFFYWSLCNVRFGGAGGSFSYMLFLLEPLTRKVYFPQYENP